MQAVSVLPSLTGSLVGLAVAAALTWVTPRHEAPQPVSTPMPRPVEIVCAEPAAPQLVAIELERRFTDLDEAVVAWEPFIYTRDAAARPAVASDVYVPTDARPRYEMMQDEYGGVWAVIDGNVPGIAAGEARPTRDIWLLPHGAAFRGVLDRR